MTQVFLLLVTRIITQFWRQLETSETSVVKVYTGSWAKFAFWKVFAWVKLDMNLPIAVSQVGTRIGYAITNNVRFVSLTDDHYL